MTGTLKNFDKVLNITSEFSLGQTITVNTFNVFRCGKIIYGYFRGSTSGSGGDPIIFSIPVKYQPMSQHFSCTACVCWTQSKVVPINFYRDNLVFASFAYTQNEECAFSFTWMF